MNVLILSAFLMLCMSIAITESRYPYEDSYRAGDVVPYANERRRQRDQDGRYPIPGSRGGLIPGTRGVPIPGNRGGYPTNRGYPIPGINGGGSNRDGSYDDYQPSDLNRRRRRNRLQPRGLAGYKRNYDNYDYDYGRYNRRQSSNRGPGFYSNDDFGYGDY